MECFSAVETQQEAGRRHGIISCIISTTGKEDIYWVLDIGMCSLDSSERSGPFGTTLRPVCFCRIGRLT